MIYRSKSNFQNHPFHLVSPSPWPLFTSISLFVLTTATVCFMHGFQGFENLVPVAIINVAYVMGLWFRDIILVLTWWVYKRGPSLVFLGRQWMNWWMKFSLVLSKPLSFLFFRTCYECWVLWEGKSGFSLRTLRRCETFNLSIFQYLLATPSNPSHLIPGCPIQSRSIAEADPRIKRAFFPTLWSLNL